MRNVIPLEVIVVSFEVGQEIGIPDPDGDGVGTVVVLVSDVVDNEVIVGVGDETVLVGGQRLTLLAVVVRPSAPPFVAELVLATGRIDCRTLLDGAGLPGVVVYTCT